MQIVTKFQCSDLKAGPRILMLQRSRQGGRKPHTRSRIMRLGARRRAIAACGAAAMADVAQIA
jgi:hypothetical protein